MKVTFNKHISTVDGSFKKGGSYDIPDSWAGPWFEQGIVSLDNEPEPVAEKPIKRRRSRKQAVREDDESVL